MRQSTKYILMASVAVVTTGVVMVLGADAAQAWTGGETIQNMSNTGLTDQLGGAARLMKQASVVVGGAMGIGGVFTFYKNAKDGFKDGAKSIVAPVTMALAGGAMMAVPFLTQSGGKAVGATGNETLQQNTGGTIGW